MRVLADSDLLLEFFANRGGHVEATEKLLEMVESRQIEMYVMDKSLDKLRSYLGDEDLIAPFQEMLRGYILNISHNLIQQARTYPSPDFESAVEIACATAMNLDAIITQNQHNFAGASLPAWSVDELLHQMEIRKLERQYNIASNTQEFGEGGKFYTKKDVKLERQYNVASNTQEFGEGGKFYTKKDKIVALMYVSIVVMYYTITDICVCVGRIIAYICVRVDKAAKYVLIRSLLRAKKAAILLISNFLDEKELDELFVEVVSSDEFLVNLSLESEDRERFREIMKDQERTQEIVNKMKILLIPCDPLKL